MKKRIKSFFVGALLLISSFFSYSQTTKVVGMGTFAGGSVFALNEDGSSPEKWVDFSYAQSPQYLTLLNSNGKMWGTTSLGGGFNKGAIFSIDEDGSNYSRVHDFDDSNGGEPYGSLIESNGKIWGMTTSGGANGFGVIFSLELDGTGYSVVHDFDDTNGRASYGSLLESNGKLWGMTISGGTSGYGVIFQLEVDGTGFTKVHDFDNTNGRNPTGNLIESDGKLWGMTRSGGVSGYGTLFSIELDGTGFTKVHDFDDTNGSSPYGNLVESNGKFWGMTNSGGSSSYGVLFSIDIDGNNFTNVHDFDDTNGSFPYGSLVERDSKFWGMTSFGGSEGGGVIFSINIDGTGFTTVHNFDNTNGTSPYGSLIESNGQFFGVAGFGGVSSAGTIFSIDTDGTNYSKLHDFSSSNGSSPFGSLIESNEILYGMTYEGGSSGYGTIFHVRKGGADFVKIHDFDGTNGRNPNGTLIESNGKLLGMTSAGGANSQGVIFSINIDGTDFTNLYDFGGTNGETPLRGLYESNGLLWGMTSFGGSSGVGIIFSLNTDGTSFTKVHDFDYTNGGLPIGGLFESDGKLWGLTRSGGSNDDGVIFSIELDGTGFTTVHDFEEVNGETPYGSLLEMNGKMWGVTKYGGDSDYGTIFSIELDGTGFTKVHDFDDTNGREPDGSLIESNGKLFGVANFGGSANLGVVFSYDESASPGSQFTIVNDFSGEIGGYPRTSLLSVVVDVTPPSITSSDNLSLSENTSGTIYTATADESVTFSLGSSNDESLFTLMTDALSFTSAPDYETPLDGDGDNEYLVELIATDGADNVSTLVVSIMVTDEDEIAPTITSSDNLSISENTSGTIYTATADESVTFSLGSSNDESLFTLMTDALSFTSVPDYETPLDGDGDNEYVVEFIATDGADNVGSLVVSITVTDEDEIAPTITSSDNLSISENTSGTIYTATADESVTFSLGSSNDESLFTLMTDAISFTNAPDYETPLDGDGDNEYLVEFIAMDGSGNVGSLVVSITVTDEDEIAPTITSLSNLSIPENTSGTIYTATADESVMFSLGSSNDESLFTLMTDAISFTSAPDYETPLDGDGDNEYLVEFIATDGSGNVGSLVVSITVTDEDEIAPTITSSDNLSIPENTSGTIYTATADESVTFSFGSSNDESLFTLMTDAISFTSAPDYETPLDEDGDNEYLVEFFATDGSGNVGSLIVSVTVTDEDEIAPTITSSDNLSIPENTSGTIYTATSDESVTFSLGSSNDESLFTLMTDAISFTNAPDFETPLDGDGDNEYLVEFLATDGSGNVGSLVVSVTVMDEDEIAPTITSSDNLSILENTSGTIYTATADESATFSLGSSNDESLFTLMIDAISFTNAPDFEVPLDEDGDNEYLVELLATDGSGNVGSLVVSIIVTDEDESDPLGLVELGIITYPNPTHRYVRIENTNPLSVRLYSLDGRQMLQRESASMITLDLGGLLPGQYILHLYDKNRLVGSGKIIKVN